MRAFGPKAAHTGALLAVLLAGPSVFAQAARPDALAAGGDQPKQDASDADQRALNKPPERRSGLVIGTMGGGGLGSSSGYPNQAIDIGDPSYYASSGLMTGTGGSLFVMGALADYLNFGFWTGGGTFANSDWHSTAFGVGLRVEAFPLYFVAPALRDLGLVGQFGIGGTTLEGKFRPGLSYDGVQSFIGAGVFYEFFMFRMIGGHLASGPSIEYNAVTTQPLERHWGMVGGRIVFYGGM